MSANRGDKSRFQINRKRAVVRREKIRELVKGTATATAAAPARRAKPVKPVKPARRSSSTTVK